eukprot:9656440-Alexandrium_andersonii.AAC.1
MSSIACLASSTLESGHTKTVRSGSKRQKISKAPAAVSAGQSQRCFVTSLSFSSSIVKSQFARASSARSGVNQLIVLVLGPLAAGGPDSLTQCSIKATL